MIMAIILLITSFLLDGFLPNIFVSFIPFFSVSAIFLINYLVNNKKRYYEIVIIYGFIYDFFYMPTIIIDSLAFFVIAYLIRTLLDKKYNIFFILIFYFIIVNIYSFLMIILSGSFLNINIYEFITNVINSLFINYLYFIFMYLLVLVLRKMHINELGDNL